MLCCSSRAGISTDTRGAPPAALACGAGRGLPEQRQVRGQQRGRQGRERRRASDGRGNDSSTRQPPSRAAPDARVRRIEAAACEPRAKLAAASRRATRPPRDPRHRLERRGVARDRERRELIERALEPGGRTACKSGNVARAGAEPAAEADQAFGQPLVPERILECDRHGARRPAPHAAAAPSRASCSRGRGRTSLKRPCAVSASMPRPLASTALLAVRNSRAPAAVAGPMPKNPKRASSG